MCLVWFTLDLLFVPRLLQYFQLPTVRKSTPQTFFCCHLWSFNSGRWTRFNSFTECSLQHFTICRHSPYHSWTALRAAPGSTKHPRVPWRCFRNLQIVDPLIFWCHLRNEHSSRKVPEAGSKKAKPSQGFTWGLTNYYGLVVKGNPSSYSRICFGEY